MPVDGFDEYEQPYLGNTFPNPGLPQKDSDPDFLSNVVSPPATSSGMEEGTVVRVHPRAHTVDVDTDNGTLTGCRVMTPYVSPLGGGQSVLPEVGAECIVCVSMSIPTVIGFIATGDSQTTDQDVAKKPSVSTGTSGFGGQDPTYIADNDINHRGGRTDTLAPGDFVIETPEGNMLAIMRGVSVLKGSELAQILMTNLGGLLRMVSSHFQHYHAAGSTEINNVDGKATYRLLIGKDVKQLGEVEPRATFSVGDEADVVEVLVTTEDGEKKFRAHVSGEGAFSLESVDLEADVNGDCDVNVDGSMSLSVDESLSLETLQSLSESVGGDRQSDVTGSSTLNTGGSLSLKSIGNTNLVSQGRFDQAVVGDSSLSYTGSHTSTHLNDFTRKLAIGPLNLVNFAGKKNGDLTLECLSKAKIGGKLSTTVQGVSVALGTPSSRFPVVRNIDLPTLADLIVNYINATGVVVVTPAPKLTIPPGAGAAVSLALPSLGSKIVKAS